jgi:Zn-dependent protease with chaperone function
VVADVPDVLDTAGVPSLLGVRTDADAVRHNRRRALLVAGVPALVVFIVVAGACVAGGIDIPGVVAGVVAGVAVWLVLWRGATGFVLRALAAGVGDEFTLARAETLVDGLCATMGLDIPDLVVVDDTARQALALGRSSATAVLVVTSGLLEGLDPVTLEGVLAHELVHVKRGDIAPATVAAALALPLARLFPVSGVVHALAGRGREFRTDRLAVAVTRYPPGLRDALVLLAEGPPPRASSPLNAPGVRRATRWLWTVALPDETGAPAVHADEVGELDAPSVRIAALDEW